MTTYTETSAHSVESRKVEVLKGWKYKSLKFGPITLPWYASPQSQLILVSFVCFLCPGEVVQHDIPPQAANYVKACSMLSTALVVLGSLARMFMPMTPQIRRFTLLLRLSVSSLAPSPTLLASESPSRSVGLGTVSTSAHTYAITTLRTSATQYLLVSG